ncbi:MAG: alpha-2-macroglobulin, partial [Methylococcales bacterium]|nr:alpha-2-macroglobulin [Methylococcales bacterium]
MMPIQRLLSVFGLLFLTCLSAQAKTTVIVPDHFLRAWDPVTVFFEQTQGQQPGPEDHPEKFVQVTPNHPGSFVWLDDKTLQFRPSKAWPALSKFTWKTTQQSSDLYSLMQPPVKHWPAKNSDMPAALDHLTLSFQAPIDPATLAKVLRLELKPRPGISEMATWLDHKHFSIKPIERKTWSSHAKYRIDLNSPIAGNQHITVHFQLSQLPSADDAFYRYHFTTEEPFRVTHLGCQYQLYVIPVSGVQYDKNQAIACSSDKRNITLQFNQSLAKINPIQARNLVHFSPSVSQLRFTTEGQYLTIHGDFLSNTQYHIQLNEAPIQDTQQRELTLKNSSALYAYFPPQSEFLRWQKSSAILEQFGPQRFPLAGRGQDKVDIRIHKIDAQDRSFWPFPSNPVTIDESIQPPIPGEIPEPYDRSDRQINSSELEQHIHALGSPSLSKLVSLPLNKNGKAYQFGLDLKPLLSSISDDNAPGTYLVGLRELDASSKRHWVRIQVTDLSLSTIEADSQVNFVVTSLKTGKPVSHAKISVEGASNSRDTGWHWTTLKSGYTNEQGQLSWQAPGKPNNSSQFMRRITVTAGNDRLTLDPAKPPKKYSDNHWQSSYQTWLQWTQETLSYRTEQKQTRCHIFTERPIYQPEHEVHIKGYLRQIYQGNISTLTGRGFVLIESPDGQHWRKPVSLTEYGSFYFNFNETDIPSGNYYVSFEYQHNKKRENCGSASFIKEVYQLPKFEVQLSGPDKTPLDTPFSVKLAAHYYAGGKVIQRPVRWRVTQFPYTWSPKKRTGFYYSTDGRFSGNSAFKSRPAMEQNDTTDKLGSSQLDIDPSKEPSAHPRRYIVESTVTGDDEQTVSSTKQIIALPPFTLALKTARYLPTANNIALQALVVDANGDPIKGQKVTLRLKHRQWHNRLEATNFSDGKAKYVSDVVDSTLHEYHFESTQAAKDFSLPITQSGVYIVEVESTDNLGRRQSVSVDLFAGGEQAVTWSQPPSEVFNVSTDKNQYKPGDIATFIFQSPFQTARVLAIIDRPDQQHQYQWINVEKGQASFTLPIEKSFLPSIPVHFLLMRGRIDNTNPSSSGMDLGKPATLASTQWISVSPVEQKLNIALTYPKKALPGETVSVDIHLTDHKGQPQAGEVTLWLVDQAVLALAQEARLNPLPDFIPNRHRSIGIKDTRNEVLGFIPMQEYPGGDMG